MKVVQKLFLISLTLFSCSSLAAEAVFSSEGERKTVIELFTSQGCSSCPPAEYYMNQFINDDRLWSKYIPLVFHVDYWDYIGWKDVFAQPVFSTRQQRYASLQHTLTVYTPAFIVNGKAWRRGFFNTMPTFKGLDSGILKVTIKGKKVTANFKSSALLTARLNLNIAILGTGLTVKILAGENEGRTAKQHFVVLGYSKQLSENNKLNNIQWEMRLPMIKQVNSTRYALAAWVSKSDDPVPLQAVAGWIKMQN